jgi:hypothetical protein
MFYLSFIANGSLIAAYLLVALSSMPHKELVLFAILIAIVIYVVYSVIQVFERVWKP